MTIGYNDLLEELAREMTFCSMRLPGDVSVEDLMEKTGMSYRSCLNKMIEKERAGVLRRVKVKEEGKKFPFSVWRRK